ncbi:hypothetical protein PFTANZ_06691 [Plasmodium falciparum Tanzania (2000708)]|uniref:Surface antigen n=1 Tax=Plasmodium falciparum Tanzania (2000708) TaxID=1036725 RepID=A0A024VWH5_PLAFA|nr:hypothetical protein PFTANZ_06691 [Plasmodium falciparum Tanzania (2000708)]
MLKKIYIFLAAAIKAGNAQGMKIVSFGLKTFGIDALIPDICEKISSTGNYTKVTEFVNTIYSKYAGTCVWMDPGTKPTACNTIEIKLSIRTGGSATQGPPPQHAIRKLLNGILEEADKAAAHVTKTTSESVTAEITKKQTALIEAGFNSSISSINAAIIAIVVIVLIMVIIYLILRYRRKKKMKKKLQYIKLLEE